MINTGMNRDKLNSQIQLLYTSAKKSTHRRGAKQRLKKAERKLKQQLLKQQLQQQQNNDLNNINVDLPDIQGTVGQLTGLQPSSGVWSPGLNAGPRLMEAGLISDSNRESTDPQINESNEDNAEEEEDEQTDEAPLNQIKDNRANLISQTLVLENLGTQPQDNQILNALSQMEEDVSGPALVGVQEKPEQRKRSRKSKTEGLNASEESQGSNALTQTKTTSKVPKHKAAPNRGKKKSEQVNPEPKNSNNEGQEEDSP
ncbi:MAG: hypothetical protein EZS28_001555 [Streblomastix strix]|uniref:Uncharacterized protein n=1 Tax=Streblomastix strix TaxID=222440 RepID=A0A5J4X6W0_9EUKA|nr:MAG: hypothetical protein EZS28_001555 [Streblomastix strix]